MPTLPARTLSITVERAPDAVAAFAGDPANLPRWAAGLAAGVRQVDGRWLARSPFGEVTVRFAPANAFGVIDHVVELPDGGVVTVPMRVVANGDGSEVLFTLFQQPGMDDARLTQDEALVRADLATLKRVLETRAAN